MAQAKDAFKLFETINNRGLSLSPTDIIKNFLLGNASIISSETLESVKEDWQADVMELQEEIILDKNESMIGKEILVMIEGKVADENAYVGRSYRDAPDIDGLVFVNTDTELVSGDFVKVRITGAYEYDLIGELM